MREHVELYDLQRMNALAQQHKLRPLVRAATRARGQDGYALIQPEALWVVGTATLRSRAQPKVLRGFCALSAHSALVLVLLGLG